MKLYYIKRDGDEWLTHLEPRVEVINSVRLEYFHAVDAWNSLGTAVRPGDQYGELTGPCVVLSWQVVDLRGTKNEAKYFEVLLHEFGHHLTFPVAPVGGMLESYRAEVLASYAAIRLMDALAKSAPWYAEVRRRALLLLQSDNETRRLYRDRVGHYREYTQEEIESDPEYIAAWSDPRVWA